MELYSVVFVCQHGLEFLLAMISQLPAMFRILSNDYTTVLAYYSVLAYTCSVNRV